MIKNILIGVLFLNALYLGYRCFHQLPTENEMYSQTLAEATKFLKEKNDWETFALKYKISELSFMQEKTRTNCETSEKRKANLLARKKLLEKTLTQGNMYAVQTADSISNKAISLVPKTKNAFLEDANFELVKHNLLTNTRIQYGQSIPFRPNHQILIPSWQNFSICEGDTVELRCLIQPNLLDDDTYVLKKGNDLDTLYSNTEGGVFIPTNNLLRDGEKVKEVTKKIPLPLYRDGFEFTFTVRKCNN